MDSFVARKGQNPFNVTKAVDFSDEEIAATWVDLREDGGFFQLVSPRSPVPRFIVGAKGIGRTHLMRYYSSALQGRRYRGGQETSIAADGYVGIYFRASGLNSGRFQGKGVSEDAWASVFMYYVDLWLAQHALAAISEVCSEDELTAAVQRDVCRGAMELFDESVTVDQPATVADLLRLLKGLQRTLDVAINNAALTQSLPVTISATPGRLVFGLPAVLSKVVSSLNSVQFLYLIDEMENFTESQQRYLNTLIREKVPPSSFMVGARLYGIRTRKTTTGEENREGSEFESIYLDRMYLRQTSQYSDFCRNMIGQRLIEAGHRELVREDLASRLDDYFQIYSHDRLGESETRFVLDSKGSQGRIYLERLRMKLLESRGPALRMNAVEEILSLLRMPDAPLIEKLNTFVFYQEWYRGADLLKTARQISTEAQAYVRETGARRYSTRLKHFRGDLLAQMLREFDQPQRYLGIDTFVRLSGGSPRLLLVILKYVYRWAVFLGQAPFETMTPISEEAQRAGVADASKWFFSDSTSIGEQGRLAQDAITRLGGFFRALRFTDKPVESSLASFSVDETTLTDQARLVLKACQEFAFLLQTPSDQRDRNTANLTKKLQLHPMLCPQWDLPISRRGATPLSTSEANALFDPDRSGTLQELTQLRLRRMNAPFGRASGAPQGSLPEL